MKNIFISYKYTTPAFSAEVRQLAAELQHFGFDVHLDQQELSYGQEIYGYMQDRIDSADALLVIVTKEFNEALDSSGEKGRGVRFEIESALRKSTPSGSFRLVPVLVEDVRPSGPLKDIKAIDLSRSENFHPKVAELAKELSLAEHPGYTQGLLGGRYRVDTMIEQRGVAHVYEGFDTRMNAMVEIYGVASSMNPDSRDMLEWASKTARSRSKAYSPFLLNYRDFLPYENGYELVTERHRGTNLELCLNQHIALPAVHICYQVCLALVEMHTAGILHCGLVPRCLRVGRQGKHTAVKIVDFEHAMPAEEAVARAGRMHGYPMAMPPERFQGVPFSEKADVYQLGALLFRILTGVCLLNQNTITGLPHMADARNLSGFAVLEDVLPSKVRFLELVSQRQTLAGSICEMKTSSPGGSWSLRWRGKNASIKQEWLHCLDVIRGMTAHEPASRPNAEEALGLLAAFGVHPSGYSQAVDQIQINL